MNESLKVFLVEDSALIRESLTATLEELAPVLVVGFAEDEQRAIQWLLDDANTCDLAVVDVFLKEGSGIEVLRAVKTASHATRRIIFTNYATCDVRERCLDLGAERVFDKSQDIDLLIDYCNNFNAVAGND